MFPIYTAIKLILLINLPHSAFSGSLEDARVPLIYTRLRFDHDFLQIYRRFQHHLARDEKKFSIQVNESWLNSENISNRLEYNFYQNENIDASQLKLDDLIFEALDRSYLTRLFPAYLFNYDNDADLKRSSDPKLVWPGKCHHDLDFLMKQLENRGHDWSSYSPELAAFFDSFAGEEPGLLFGNYHWTGNWRQCSRRHILHLDRQNLDKSVNFKGRYCIASIRSRDWSAKIAERKVELMKSHFKYHGQSDDYERFFRIQVGICLPESCDSQVVRLTNSFGPRRSDIRRLAVHKLSEPLRSYELADLYCLPDETSELRRLDFSGRSFIMVALVWLTLVLVASVWDYLTRTEHPQRAMSHIAKLVDSLSLLRSFERLFEAPPAALKTASHLAKPQQTRSASPQAKSPGAKEAGHRVEEAKLSPNDLLFLNAIKVISTPLVLMGHAGMMIKHLDRYVIDYEGLNSDFLFHFQASTPFYVDWFFVISGFLTTYLMFVTHKVERNSLVQWAYAMFHRYWRLAPIYLLLVWFSKSVFMHTSYGPLWDYGTSNMTLRAICRRESWIYPLTLTSNWHPIHEECIMPAWYVANDMQYFLLTPFLLILLHRSPLLGWLVSLGSIGVCISLRLHRYLTDPRAQPLELMRPRYDLYMRNNWDLHATYIYPQYRIATYLIGVLAGHYTYMVLSGKWNSALYPRDEQHSQVASGPPSESQRASKSSRGAHKCWLRLAAWLLGVQLLVTMSFATWLISDLFPVSLEPWVRYFTALIYALDHSAVGLGMALVLVTLMLGQFRGLRALMSHPNWTILSRINFVAFLTQVELIYWLMQSADRPTETSSLELFKFFSCLCVFTYLSSFVLTLLLEIPLAQLERQFVGPLFAKSGSGSRSAASLTSPAAPRLAGTANKAPQAAD